LYLYEITSGAVYKYAQCVAYNRIMILVICDNSDANPIEAMQIQSLSLSPSVMDGTSFASSAARRVVIDPNSFQYPSSITTLLS
jgi:hypothetical protein